LYLCLDGIHVSIVFTVLYLLFNLQCSLKKLLILNIIYLFVVLCFYYHKRCALSIYQNKIINKEVSWTGPIDRIVYFLNPEKPYINSKSLLMQGWIDGNKQTCVLIIVLNLYCLSKLWSRL